MKQIRILKNFNLFLIYRVYLIVFATVLITYEQNYIYMYIQIYILKSFSFFSFFFHVNLKRKYGKSMEKRGDRCLFSYWCTASLNFLNTEKYYLSYTRISFTISIVCCENLHGNTNSQEVSTPISLAREPTVLIYFLTAEATAGLANWLLFTVQRNETEKEEIKSSIYSRYNFIMMTVIMILPFFESYYFFQLRVYL